MRRYEEQARADSCWNKARHDEMLFVLLGRDVASPAAIVAWCNARITAGKNKAGDPQIVDALACADAMLADQAEAARA